MLSYYIIYLPKVCVCVYKCESQLCVHYSYFTQNISPRRVRFDSPAELPADTEVFTVNFL